MRLLEHRLSVAVAGLLLAVASVFIAVFLPSDFGQAEESRPEASGRA